MAKRSAGEMVMREWHEKWINTAIQAYYVLHPKPRKSKKPELGASTIRSQKVYLRNSKGELIAIYGSTTGYFNLITPEKIKKHSIINKKPRAQAQSTKTL